jgi:ribosome-associated protein
MTSNFKKNNMDGDDSESKDEHHRPNKSQAKRDSHHLVNVGESIIKLKAEEIQALDLPEELEHAVNTARKIKSRSGLKRQRLYIGKLLRSIDSEHIETQLKKIQHRHDTNTARFKRLEMWRDKLIENDKGTLNDVIASYPELDRQHINQLIRAAQQEKKRDNTPTAARKLFKYLSELADA